MSAAASSPPADDPVVAAAIEWMVLLRSGEAGAAEHESFAQWRRSDARHEAAAARLEQALGAIQALPDAMPARDSARRVLLVSSSRRKLLRNTLALLIVGGGAGLLAQRVTPLRDMTADLHTSTGERKHVRLADGSEIWLNARSAADVDFGTDARRIRLRDGEIVVDVAHDAQRPFIVQTPQGSMRALGTRFLVRQEEGGTVLAVLHSSVRIDTAEGHSSVLHAGQSARFDAVDIVPMETPAAAATAWTGGLIEVRDRPLGEVIAALRRYRFGFLRVTPQAAALRVTGIFSLDDSERTLAALAETLPIAIRRRTDYWISIDRVDASS